MNTLRALEYTNRAFKDCRKWADETPLLQENHRAAPTHNDIHQHRHPMPLKSPYLTDKPKSLKFLTTLGVQTITNIARLITLSPSKFHIDVAALNWLRSAHYFLSSCTQNWAFKFIAKKKINEMKLLRQPRRCIFPKCAKKTVYYLKANGLILTFPTQSKKSKEFRFFHLTFHYKPKNYT